MADVTIRNPQTLEERDVDETAIPFFPNWVVLDKAGRVKAHQPATATTTKEN